MAVGLGLLFGIRLPENFNYPYCAASLSAFWRRWHMSLSGWFRDYLYIRAWRKPEGHAAHDVRQAPRLSRHGPLARKRPDVRALGPWHGLWSCVETALHLPKKLERKWYGHVYTLLVVIFGFALFRAASPAQGFALWRAMLTGFHADNVCRAALSDAADYFAGRFGLRQELITADAAVRAAVFHESAADDVLLGTDGWLYNADTLGDFTGSSAMTERQLWCAARNLALMQEYAASRGAQLLFVCAPNKNTVYPRIHARALCTLHVRAQSLLALHPPSAPARAGT